MMALLNVMKTLIMSNRHSNNALEFAHVEHRRAVEQPVRGRDPQVDLASLVADVEGLVRLALGDVGGELCRRQFLVRHVARVGVRARRGVRARHIQP
eukprot:COSAG05_NODE_1792_length_4082_cov_3.402963_4_plen_97_part_00